MLLLKNTDGTKILISPRYFVATYEEGGKTYVITTACEFTVEDTVDEIIEAITLSAIKQGSGVIRG